MALRVRETTETSSRVATARLVEGCQMEVTVRDFPKLAADEPPHHGGTDRGPTPLEYVTAGLAACQTVTIAKLAEALRFRYRSLNVRAETEVGWIDSRKSTQLIPRFTKAKLVVDLETDESEIRLARLKGLVEERCPASNLFLDAGLAPKMIWHVTKG